MLFSGFPQTIWHWSKISSCHYRNHFVLTCHRVLSSFHRPWYLSLSHPQRKRNAPPATKGRSYCISNFRRTRNETQHQTRIEMPLYSSPVPSHLLQSLLQHRDIYQISMSLLMRVMSHRTHNMYDELPLHYLIMSTLKPNRLSDYRTAGTGDITWIMGSSLAGTYLDRVVFTGRDIPGSWVFTGRDIPGSWGLHCPARTQDDTACSRACVSVRYPDCRDSQGLPDNYTIIVLHMLCILLSANNILS